MEGREKGFEVQNEFGVQNGFEVQNDFEVQNGFEVQNRFELQNKVHNREAFVHFHRTIYLSLGRFIQGDSRENIGILGDDTIGHCEQHVHTDARARARVCVCVSAWFGG